MSLVDFGPWMGKTVVMHVSVGGSNVSLPCRIVGESNACVRVRLGDNGDVDIYKDMIGTIETDNDTA